MVKIKISSQLVFVDSNFSQFVLIWSICTHLVNSSALFGQLVHILVNSYSFWSSRANGSCHFVLILGPLCIYRTEKETQNERMQCLKIMYCCEILNFAYT